jgi:hypothetical protein
VFNFCLSSKIAPLLDALQLLMLSGLTLTCLEPQLFLLIIFYITFFFIKILIAFEVKVFVCMYRYIYIYIYIYIYSRSLMAGLIAPIELLLSK